MSGPFGDRFINLMEEGLGSLPRELRTRFDQALARAPRSGPLTIYVPERIDLDARGLEVPSRCEFFMAPGAIIKADPGARLALKGATDLGMEPRFEFVAGGVVELLGPLDAIRPEWWIGSVDHALQSAVKVAIRRYELGAPEAPVRLSGSYELQESLDLSHLAGGRSTTLAFMGSHPPGDGVLPPTLIRGSLMSSTSALVRVQSPVSARFDHVAFDTSRSDSERGGRPAPAVECRVYGERIEFVRCSFFGSACVSVDVSPGGREAQRTVFRECWFESGAGVEPGLFGIDAAGDCRLRIEGCSFVGGARSMIDVREGFVDVVGCFFDNISLYDDSCDIRGGDAPAEAKTKRAGGTLQLNEVHVRTRSRRHLRADMQPGSSTVCLTGVVQEVARATSSLGLIPEAIRWDRPLTNAMLLQGCSFSGPIGVLPTQGVVVAATTLGGTPQVAAGTMVRYR